LTARGLQEQAFTFDITHKLWLMTNHKPALDTLDAALRGRLHMIPFDMRWNRPGHPERSQLLPDGDKTLPDKLKAEIKGILAWLVTGAVAYQREGLEPPDEVAGMTRTYFSDQDPFGQWFAKCEVCDAKVGTSPSDLFLAFSSWCDEEDFDHSLVGSQKAFSSKLSSRGVVLVRTGGVRKYGLIFRPYPDDNSDLV